MRLIILCLVLSGCVSHRTYKCKDVVVKHTVTQMSDCEITE